MTPNDIDTDGTYRCPVSPEHTTIPRENTGDADMWCVDCHGFRNRDTDGDGNRTMTEEIIEIELESFAFWQAQMAHAAEKAANDPDYNGDAFSRAHQQMHNVLKQHHETR